MADEKNGEGQETAATLIEPPKTLQDKVGPPQPGGIDLKALERAEAVISNLSDQYFEWVQGDLKSMQEAYNQLKAQGGADADQLKKIFSISHDVKGQGGSFGYDLMTTVGNSLCRFIEGKTSLDAAHMDIVKLHVDTLKLIIAQDIQGDGGAMGQKILTGLTLAADKVGGN